MNIEQMQSESFCKKQKPETKFIEKIEIYTSLTKDINGCIIYMVHVHVSCFNQVIALVEDQYK